MHRVESIEQKKVEKLKEKSHTDDDSKSSPKMKSCWDFSRFADSLFLDRGPLPDAWIAELLRGYPGVQDHKS